MLLLVVVGPLVQAMNRAWQLPASFMGQFRHGWECFTLWDIIMPLFIFMCGAAIPFALARRIENGKAGKSFWIHVFGRVAMLWALGMLVQGDLLSLDWHKISPYSNTLQSIAAGYFVTACVMLIKSKAIRVAVPVVLALAYTAMLAFGGDYTEFGNFAFKVDRAVLSAMLPADNPFVVKPSHYTWFATSLMFAVMTLAGYHAAEMLRGDGEKKSKAVKLLAYGAGLEIAGWAVSPWIPVIKPIFTLSATTEVINSTLDVF